MCHVWQNPSHPDEEVSLETLEKAPAGVDNLNITGGEPTLREDLLEIVDVLYPKARKLEISSNGLRPERLEPAVAHLLGQLGDDQHGRPAGGRCRLAAQRLGRWRRPRDQCP